MTQQVICAHYLNLVVFRKGEGMRTRMVLLVFLPVFFFASDLFASMYLVDKSMSYARIYKTPEIIDHNDYTRFADFTDLCEFDDVNGYFEYDGGDPENWFVYFNMTIESLTMGDKVLENILKGPDFFNSEKNKRISFYIDPRKKGNAKVMIVFGDIIKFTSMKNFEIKLVDEEGKIYPAATNNGIAKASFKLKFSDLGMDVKDLLLYEIDPQEMGLKDEVNLAFHLRGSDPLN